MRILYVVARAVEVNASSSIRNNATINGLIENGHDVTVVSCEPSDTSSNYDPSLRPEGAKIVYFKLGGAHTIANKVKGGWLNKLLKSVYRLFKKNDIYDNLKPIINHVEEIDVKNFDLVISSSDPKSSHLFVDKLFKYHHCSKPWIQIWGDPFADDISMNHTNLSKIKREENRLLSLATKVVYVSYLSCISQKKKYPANAHKMAFVPIPYYKERISDKEFPDSFEKAQICYCGDYVSCVRNLTPLYEAVKDLGMKMTVCGRSDIVLNSTNNITVLPRQSASFVRELEDTSDILIHLSNLSGTQVPGKIFQYAATNKTIVFILDGDSEMLKEMFGKYNRFIFVNNDKESIKYVLSKIAELKETVSNVPLKEYSCKYISKEIVDLVNFH